MTKNTAGEIRAAVMQIEEDGGLPMGLLQAAYENNTGYRDEQNGLPKHRQSEQPKEDEIVEAGLRMQEKLGEFGGNRFLATHAFNYGDKATSAALENGFKQDELDDTYGVMARVGKYGGEPFTSVEAKALAGVVGAPSKDFSKAATTPPPKPQRPKAQGISSLRSAIFGGESGGNYNIVNRGKRHGYGAGQVNLTEKTVDQVLADQDRGDYKAAGAYQIIPKTLRSAKKALGLSGSEQFTPELQDRIFSNYLAKSKRPPLRDYIMGKSDNIKAAHTALAQEWASVDRGDGLSYYHGDGVNKAHIPLQKTMSAVKDMRDTYQANIQAGMSEDEAYSQALLGGTTGNTVATTAQTPQGATEYAAPQTMPTETSAEPAQEVAQQDEQPVIESFIDGDVDEGEEVEVVKPDWRAIAKKAFSTKKESYVPKTVSQAVRGAISGV